MRRRIPTLLLISATLAVSACGEYSTTEPLPSAKNAGLTPSFAGYAVSGDDQSNLAAASLVPGAPTTPVQVTFNAAGGSINFGGLFTLVYRQNSVSLCNSDGTGCSRLTGSVTVPATYGLNSKGAPYIDVGTTPDGLHLFFATPGAKLSTTFYANRWQSIVASGQQIGLLFAPTPGAPSELNAPKSHFDAGTGALWRWISHFSGYAVSGDGNCDPTVDPTCALPPDLN